MAITAFGTNDAQTVKLWSTLTLREALKQTMFKKFMGKDKRSIIMRLSELEKQAGDEIKYDILLQMGNTGVVGDNRLKGNEEAMTYKQDSVVIDQLRNGHAFRRMSQQRTVHDLREDAKINLADWFADRFDNIMFAHLCGDTTETFANTPVAPSYYHYVMSGDVSETGAIATDETSLGTNDQFTLADMDFCKEKAKTFSTSTEGVWIRPTIVNGEEYYVVVLHPYSVTDLRLDVANSAYVSWPDIQMYANKRGLNNPIFTGALGVYNGMVIHESTRIYSPTSNVRRNLFLGAQAGVVAFGNAYKKMAQRRVGKDNMMSWFEEEDDYGNEEGIAVGSVFGMKACKFDVTGGGTDYDLGKLVISSYAAKHTAV
jgi:N4-gp56 family major capsid protein